MDERQLKALETDDIRSILESLLLVATEPVETAVFAEILGVERDVAKSALEDLSMEYSELGRGFQLRYVAGGWRLYTHPSHDEAVRAFVKSWDTRKLSAAALETLAVIAYTQPATRDGVRAVRGVNSDSAISSLIDKGLVRELTHREGVGASTFGTTKAFLERFGLHDLNDLPPLEDFAPDEQTRKLISERLGAKMATTAAGDGEEDEAAGGLAADATDASPDADPDGAQSTKAMTDVDGEA